MDVDLFRHMLEKGGGRELNSPQRHLTLLNGSRSKAGTRDIVKKILKMKRKFNQTKLFYLFMTLLIAVTIFYASSIQTTAGVPSGLNLATLYHFGIFFVFTFFLTLTLLNKKLNSKTILIVLLLSLIYALSDEFHQLFVVGRIFSPVDILIDFTGSVFSILFLKIFERFKKI